MKHMKTFHIMLKAGLANLFGFLFFFPIKPPLFGFLPKGFLNFGLKTFLLEKNSVRIFDCWTYLFVILKDFLLEFLTVKPSSLIYSKTIKFDKIKINFNMKSKQGLLEQFFFRKVTKTESLPSLLFEQPLFSNFEELKHIEGSMEEEIDRTAMEIEPNNSERQDERTSLEKNEDQREIQSKPTSKLDLRKLKSGRKSKPLSKVLEDYMKNIHYKGWLKEENRIEESGEMKSFLFCAWCRETNKSNQMAEGILFSIDNKICKTFSSTRLQEHGKENRQHKQAKISIFQKKFALTPTQVSSQNFSTFEQLNNLLEFLLLNIKKNIPIKATIELIQFCKIKGLEIPNHYLCYNSIKELILTMAEEKQFTLVQEINSSPFFSLAIDGATDISKVKSVCINVLYLFQEQPKWVYLESLFLKSFDAQTIYKNLTAFLDNCGIDFRKKLVCLCTDGEPVLRSSKNGVFGFLKRDIPALIGLHCLAHKFSLAHSQDLGSDFPILQELFKLVYETYKYFNNSPSRLDLLFENENEMEDLLEALNLVKPTKIRWLSLFTAVQRVTRILKAIVLTFKDLKDVMSKSLLVYFQDPRCLAWMHFLADIAVDFKFVTTLFQENYFNMKAAFRIISSMKENINRKYVDNFKPGSLYTSFLSKFQTINDKVIFDNFLVLNGKFDTLVYQAEFRDFCISLCQVVDKRFNDLYNLYAFE